MSKFDAEYYSRFRPFYPEGLFDPLIRELKRQGGSSFHEIADIGCGTGHSTVSLIRCGVQRGLDLRVTGVDPDPAMLAKAATLSRDATFATFIRGSGECTGLTSGQFDALTVGSAFHWMDTRAACEEFYRLLKPGGLILIYEYQFPKAQRHADLNEWIRREFNLRWKAPFQKPRGDFTGTVTACFRQDARFEVVEDRKVPMLLPLGSDDVTGLLLSQSRVLHYENALSVDERAAFRLALAGEMRARLGEGDVFDFNLQSALFSRV